MPFKLDHRRMKYENALHIHRLYPFHLFIYLIHNIKFISHTHIIRNEFHIENVGFVNNNNDA